MNRGKKERTKREEEKKEEKKNNHLRTREEKSIIQFHTSTHLSFFSMTEEFFMCVFFFVSNK
jgi:hypothetical protein